MTEYHNPKVYVRKGVTDYQTFRDNNVIIYRPNQAQIANVLMENSDGSLNDVFNPEDQVSVKIEGETMLTGFIAKADPVFKNFKKLISLQIIDWVGYLAAKIPTEKNYDVLTPATSVMLESGQNIHDGTTALGYNVIDYSLDSKILKDYFGTYTKDVWNDVAKSANAYWFGDENKKLNFFGAGSRVFREGGGNIYTLQDFPSGAAGQIMVKMDYEHNFLRDASYKFKNVKVMNGQIETWPQQGKTDFLVTDKRIDDNGNEVSNHFFFMDANNDEHLPTFEAGPLIGSEEETPTPAISFQYGTNPAITMYCNVSFISDNNQSSIVAPEQLLSIPIGKFERFKFFIYFLGVGQGLQKIELRLVDATSGGTDYWFRDILPDMRSQNTGESGQNGFVWLDYPLPTAPTTGNDLGPANNQGWQKNRPGATLNAISYMQFRVFPGEGWDETTTMKFAMPFFWKRLSASVNGSGTPATTKLIVVKDYLSKSAMQDYANKEYGRTSQDMISAAGTIEGNTVFKNPGYLILINYVSTLNSQATAVLTMREIVHRIHGGRYTTTLNCVSANQRI